MRMPTTPNFTPKSQQLIVEAKVLATELNHAEVQDSHLLSCVLSSGSDLINAFLRNFSIDIVKLIDFVSIFGDLEQEPPNSESPPYSSSFKRILSLSYDFSQKLDHGYIGIEHLFFVFLSDVNGACSTFFYTENLYGGDISDAFLLLLRTQDLVNLNKDSAGISNSMRNHYRKNRPSRPEADAQASNPLSSPPLPSGSALESFCINLTEIASEKVMGKIIGKSDEINRLCEILGRKIKNNPLLLGDPGVGKTAVVEGLAQRISSAKVPSFLSKTQIYTVDLASMIAGTKYRGQFEKRLKSLISECSLDKNIVLFIDEIHTLVGAGSAEGTMDAANILKPALARGDIKLIGATTYSEHKKSIEKDMALSRRFETVSIEEPSTKECIEILKGIKSSYESFHGVKYPVAILKKIVSLCDAYLPSRNFPDKAIDVMDEVGAKLKIKNLTPPPKLMDLENKIYNLFDSSAETGEEEDELIGDYNKLLYKWEGTYVGSVQLNDILDVISSKSKIPKENLIHEKDKKSSSLGRSLNLDIINQRSAVESIHKAIMRSKIGLKDPEKPIGSFLFLGSTGVGKTWAAKRLAYRYFGSEKSLIRFDMSEYSEKVSSSKLIGASPGYVGYEEGGVLIESLKKKPHCVILFDEIEKSHPDVQQLLLQILEEGELEDNAGNKAFFKDTIIILTSNIGSDLTYKSTLGFGTSEDSNDSKIKDEAKKILSPELINRLDDVIVFNHLEAVDLTTIFKYQIKLLTKKLRSRRIKLSIPDDLIDFLCDKAAREKMGARPLKRLIHTEIEDAIVNYCFKNSENSSLLFNFYLYKDKVRYKID